MFKSGYIGIIGRPNVGKSTLFNALVGQKIAAVTDKPQTTRHRILGIKTVPEAQLLFIDTPGLHDSQKNLNHYMMEVARSVLDDVDLFLFVVEPTGRIHPKDREIYEGIRARKKPILLLINKIDRVAKPSFLPLIDQYQKEFQPEAIVPTSALHCDGLSRVEEEILKRLPEGPRYYPEDQVTDVSSRFIASEVIREKATSFTREEIPYSLTVEIESYEEPPEGKKSRLVRIRASIIIERESQKGIVIGKGGAMIKKIGELSRKELEERLGQKVFLELFVRVEENWTKDLRKVKELGYSVP